MKREIITTADGSVTIYLPEMEETYHSKFGAVQEAYHVFIKNGLDLTQSQPVSVLEIGFGTGLNALITLDESERKGQQVTYTGVEAYPVSAEEVSAINYADMVGAGRHKEIFMLMHSLPWGERAAVNANFSLLKRKQVFHEIEDSELYDLIYFDAFGYHVQPELWSAEIFGKMYNALKSNGILVTYACRTPIKKAMQEAGFVTEKLQGPPGKREMLRALKR